MARLPNIQQRSADAAADAAEEVTGLLLIYTKSGCPYCEEAKKHYRAEGIPFDEVNLSIHPERIQEMKQLAKKSNRVPVIVDNGEVTVGFNGSG